MVYSSSMHTAVVSILSDMHTHTRTQLNTVEMRVQKCLTAFAPHVKRIHTKNKTSSLHVQNVCTLYIASDEYCFREQYFYILEASSKMIVNVVNDHLQTFSTSLLDHIYSRNQKG